MSQFYNIIVLIYTFTGVYIIYYVIMQMKKIIEM